MKKILITLFSIFTAATAYAAPYQCYNTYSGQNCGTDYVMLGLNCGAATDAGDPNASSVASWDAYCDGLAHGSGVNCLATAWNAAYNAAICRCDTGWAGSVCDTCASGYILIDGNCVYFSDHSIIYDDDTTGGSATPDTVVTTVNPETGADADKITGYAGGDEVFVVDSSSSDYFKINGRVSASDVRTTIDQTGLVYGPENFLDTSIEAWTNPTTPTTWSIYDLGGVAGAAVDQETVEVHTGSNAVKISTTGNGGTGRYLYQCVSGLTPGQGYGMAAWLKRPTGVDTTVQFVAIDGDLNGSPTEMWDPDASDWIAFAQPFPSDDKTLLADGWEQEGMTLTVPASGTICFFYSVEDDKLAYFDDFTAKTVTATSAMTLWQFTNPTDSTKLTSLDNVFDFITEGGTGFHWLTMTGTGIIETDLASLDFGNENLTTIGNITITGTGDLSVADESILHDVEVDLITNNLTGASTNYIQHFFDESNRTTAISYMQAGSNSTPILTLGYTMSDNLVVSSADNSSVYKAKLSTANLAAGNVAGVFKAIPDGDLTDSPNSYVGAYKAELSDGNAASNTVGLLIDQRSYAFDYGLLSIGNDLKIGTATTYGGTSAGPDIHILGADANTAGNGSSIHILAGNAADDDNGGSLHLGYGSATGGNDGRIKLQRETSVFGEFFTDDKNAVLFVSEATDSAETSAFMLYADANFTTDGSKLLSVGDNATGTPSEKFYIDLYGQAGFGNYLNIFTDEYNSTTFQSGIDSSVAFRFGNKSLMTVSTDRIAEFYQDNFSTLVSYMRLNGAIYSGTGANETDFPDAQAVFSNSNTGLFMTSAKIGSVSEASATNTLNGIGSLNLCKASNTNDCHAGYFITTVDDTSNTTEARAGTFISIPTHAGGDNIAVQASAAGGANNYALKSLLGDMLFYGKAWFGFNADRTDFPNTRMIVSEGNTGQTDNYESGAVFEGVGGTTYDGVGAVGYGKATADRAGIGFLGIGVPESGSGNPARGLSGESKLTNTGGTNIAVSGDASGGLANWSFYSYDGDIYNSNLMVDAPTTTLNIVAADGITAAQKIKSNLRVQCSGSGNCDLTANPQIADGKDGEWLEVECQDDTKTVQFDDGNGLQLEGGVSFTCGQGDVIGLRWNNARSLWIERFRSDN